MTTDLKMFEQMYKSLKRTQHKNLFLDLPTDQKTTRLLELMPILLSGGTTKVDCRTMYHPKTTCRGYAYDRLSRQMINGLKLCTIAQLIPAIMRNRKKLFQIKDPELALRTLVKILIGYIRAALYICLGTGLPTVLICAVPFPNLPFKWMRFGGRVSLIYSLFPNICLGVDAANRMPAYMGFFVSKGLSMAWTLLKYKTAVRVIPGEKVVTFAILAGLVGYLSAKTAQLKVKKEKIGNQQGTAARLPAEGVEEGNASASQGNQETPDEGTPDAECEGDGQKNFISAEKKAPTASCSKLPPRQVENKIQGTSTPIDSVLGYLC